MPGTYKVVVINGRFRDSTMVTVKPDPMLDIPMAEYQAKEAAFKEMVKVIQAANEGWNRLQEVRNTVRRVDAAMVLMRASQAAKLGLQPIARIVGHTTHAGVPALFPSAPVGAMQKLLAKTGWTVTDVDLFEINEAFAVVTMAAIHDMKLPVEKVNIHGGACALGHPIGASGARIIVTLLGALKKYGMKRGVASLCIGGGEATALAVEML